MLIKRPNLLSIRQQFEPDGLPAEGRIELLQRILGGLLERDQTKISSMAVEIGVDPKLTYRPHEQTRWLCHFLEGADPPDLAYIASATAR
ncbi:hypothetical protein, partial [Frankia sp. AvcI1]